MTALSPKSTHLSRRINITMLMLVIVSHWACGDVSELDVGETYRGAQTTTAPLHTYWWDVQHQQQTSDLNVGESACGPTSNSMILRYYYPNSDVGLANVYHNGTQEYQFEGPAYCYRNVGHQFVGKYQSDTGFSILPDPVCEAYYKGEKENSGMNQNRFVDYMSAVWHFDVQRDKTIQGVYDLIKEGPLVANVFMYGRAGYGHYIVIHGLDDYAPEGISDNDIVYIKDPYNPGITSRTFKEYFELDTNTAWHRGVPFGHRLVSLFKPRLSKTARQHSVVVDLSHNSVSGQFSTHRFSLGRQDGDWHTTNRYGEHVWQYYYGPGACYYPIDGNQQATWVPRLTKNGRYRVVAITPHDSVSGSVTYQIKSSANTQKHVRTIAQNRANRTYVQSVIAEDIELKQGDYVWASKIDANSCLGAVRFEYLGPISQATCTKGKPGSHNYCSKDCPCPALAGDCDDHATSLDCQPGLVCARDVGKRFGAFGKYDFCLPTHCVNGLLDEDELTIDCGGSCGGDAQLCGVVDQPSTGKLTEPTQTTTSTGVIDVVGVVRDPDGVGKVTLVVSWGLFSKKHIVLCDGTCSGTSHTLAHTINLADLGLQPGKTVTIAAHTKDINGNYNPDQAVDVVTVTWRQGSPSSGKITSPADGHQTTDSTIRVRGHVSDLDGWEKVTLAVCGKQVNVCSSNCGTDRAFDVLVDLSHVAVNQSCAIGLWGRDRQQVTTLLDDINITRRTKVVACGKTTQEQFVINQGECFGDYQDGKVLRACASLEANGRFRMRVRKIGNTTFSTSGRMSVRVGQKTIRSDDSCVNVSRASKNVPKKVRYVDVELDLVKDSWPVGQKKVFYGAYAPSNHTNKTCLYHTGEIEITRVKPACGP